MKTALVTAQHPSVKAIKSLSALDRYCFLKAYQANLLYLCQDIQKSISQLRDCFYEQEDKDLVVLQISSSCNNSNEIIFDDLVIKTPNYDLEVYFKRVLGVLEAFSVSGAVISTPEYTSDFENASKRLVQAQLNEFGVMPALIAGQTIVIYHDKIEIDLRFNDISNEQIRHFIQTIQEKYN